MSDETAPTPESNLLLRQMQGMRRDMHELMEREARMIDLVNRLALRVDEGFTRVSDEIGRVRRDQHDMRGDLVLMENRILTAITEVRRLADRFDAVAEIAH